MESMRTVTQGLPVQLVVSQEMSLSMCMRLRYELSDPYAVRVAFTVDESDEAVEWITGRDLQIDGLKGRVGEETFGSGQLASMTAVLCTSSSSRPVLWRCSKFRRRTSKGSCRRQRHSYPEDPSPSTSTRTR